LEHSAKGQKVLTEYDKHHTLSMDTRQALVKIAATQLVDDCGQLVHFLIAIVLVIG